MDAFKINRDYHPDKMLNVVLASASPRRRDLIKKIPYVIATCVSADIEEVSLPDAVQTATVNAREKARYFLSRYPNTPIIGCDTVVESDGKVFGKPKDADEVIQMYKSYYRQPHRVITAIALLDGDETEVICTSQVSMRTLDINVINRYIEQGLPFDKAGGYGIQDSFLAPLNFTVAGGRNDYYNVCGLPVETLDALLKEKYFNGSYGYSD